MKTILLLSCVLTLALGAFACGASEEAGVETHQGACREMASRCHPVKTALGQECHTIGHDGDDAACGPRREECLRECPELTEPEPEPDAATTPELDAGGDAELSRCELYCECMDQVCAAQPSYPYAEKSACLSACASFSADDLACYFDACEGGRFSVDVTHSCEHAGGVVACH